MANSTWDRTTKTAKRIWQEFLAIRLDRKLRRPYSNQASEESVGQFGERVATEYLERKGYLILERSFRLKMGEIDIIALWRKSVVVFVEVKTWERVIPNSDSPSDAVTLAKQGKITRTALVYLKQNHLLECRARADVIAIVLGETPHRPRITHYENAFESVGKYQFYC